MSNNYNIILWNANGLSQHRQEILIFLKNNKVDVMLISETHFTKKSFIHFPQYTIYNTLHPSGTARGGTAVIIKTNIKHHEIEKYQQDNIQATSVVIEDCLGPFTISAIYCSPNYINKESHFNLYFKSLGRRFIAGGDYNAKHQHWGSRLVTPRGRELLKSILHMKLDVISTGEPTYWPTDRRKIPDVIDFCIIGGISREYFNAKSCLELSSDHSPVIITINKKIPVKGKPAILTNKNTDWENFRRLLEQSIQLSMPLSTEDEITDAVEHLNDCIQQASWSSTATKINRNESSNCSIAASELLALKRKIRKQWQHTRSPELKTKLNQTIKNLKKILTQEKEESIKNYLQGLSASEANDYTLWKATKKINKTYISIPPIRSNEGLWAKSNKEKAELFAKHLENVFTPNSREISAKDEDEIHQFLETTHQLELPIKKFKTSEVKSIINSNLNPKKSPGYDLITGKILKELPPKIIIFITQLFNAILRTSIYPMQWKVAQIVMIPKPGKSPEEITAYRPISLLPIVSKVFEKLLLKRLLPHIESHRLIPDHQFGFRQKHGTIEQVHRLIDIIHNNIEEKKLSSVAFLDITQAFDKVWHTGLLYKIKKNLPINFYTILCSYLDKRHFLIKHQEEYTSLHTIKSGVPQGSILGPFLYLLFTNDFPTTVGTQTATFADDTAIISSHKDPSTASSLLQVHLNKTQDWLKKWRIKINSSKCVHVTFTTKRDTCPPVSINGQEIPIAEEAKYLGIHLDKRLTWRKHIFTKRKQLGLKLRSMYWMLSRNSALSIEMKLLIYKAILKPVWTYGIQLWGAAAKSNTDILQRFQSKILRIITNAPWFTTNDYLHKELNVPTVNEEIKKYAISYRNRIAAHPNTLVENLMEIRSNRRLKRKIPSDLAEQNP